MAIWQFDSHVLPAAKTIEVYGSVPLFISRGDFDRIEWWHGINVAGGFLSDIGKLLPKLESWSGTKEQWGLEDGDRIDVTRDDCSIVSILVRLDVRRMSHTLLVNLTAVLRRYDLLLRDSDGRVIQPSRVKLLRAIHRSPSFRFVEDPGLFLASLPAECDNDTD